MSVCAFVCLCLCVLRVWKTVHRVWKTVSFAKEPYKKDYSAEKTYHFKEPRKRLVTVTVLLHDLDSKQVDVSTLSNVAKSYLTPQ